jgi:hypothetical protein
VFSVKKPYYRADVLAVALEMICKRLAEDTKQYTELAADAQKTLESLKYISVPPDTEELPTQVHQRKVRKYSKRKESELKQSLQGVLIP